MSTTPNLVGTPKCWPAKIVNADASTQKDVVTAGINGSKVTALIATSDDASARILQVSLLRSAVNYPLCSVSVPIGAGTNGTASAVDLLSSRALPGLPVDNDGQRYLLLESGDVLQVKSLSTVTSAKVVAIVGIAGDF